VYVTCVLRIPYNNNKLMMTRRGETKKGGREGGREGESCRLQMRNEIV